MTAQEFCKSMVTKTDKLMVDYWLLFKRGAFTAREYAAAIEELTRLKNHWTV